MCSTRKYPCPPQRSKIIGNNPRGREYQKPKETVKLKWNFEKGLVGEGQIKEPYLGGVWIYFGITQPKITEV